MTAASGNRVARVQPGSPGPDARSRMFFALGDRCLTADTVLSMACPMPRSYGRYSSAKRLPNALLPNPAPSLVPSLIRRQILTVPVCDTPTTLLSFSMDSNMKTAPCLRGRLEGWDYCFEALEACQLMLSPCSRSSQPWAPGPPILGYRYTLGPPGTHAVFLPPPPGGKWACGCARARPARRGSKLEGLRFKCGPP